MEVFLFVPGFFGFGAFGHPDRPLIEYFARVEDALLRAHLRPARFVVPGYLHAEIDRLPKVDQFAASVLHEAPEPGSDASGASSKWP